MSREAALIGVLVFAFVAIGGISAQYQSAVEGSQDETTITNESFNVIEDELRVLNESRRDVVYNETAVVYQDGSRIVADGNYTWYPGNGTLGILNNTSFNESKAGAVTYGFTVPAGAQATARDIALIPYVLGDGLGIVVGAALLLTALVVLGRQR